MNNSLPRVAKTVGASVLDSIDDIIKSSQTLALTSPLSNEPLIDTIRIRVEPGSIDEMAANPPPPALAPASAMAAKYFLDIRRGRALGAAVAAIAAATAPGALAAAL